MTLMQLCMAATLSVGLSLMAHSLIHPSMDFNFGSCLQGTILSGKPNSISVVEVMNRKLMARQSRRRRKLSFGRGRNLLKTLALSSAIDCLDYDGRRPTTHSTGARISLIF